jgi:hypothetical protein
MLSNITKNYLSENYVWQGKVEIKVVIITFSKVTKKYRKKIISKLGCQVVNSKH